MHIDFQYADGSKGHRLFSQFYLFLLTGGGTIYWTYSQNELMEPTGLYSNTFVSNTAMYGNDYATQGISLLMGNNDTSTIEITDYNDDVPSFTVILVDFYGSRVVSQSYREVSVAAQPSTCYTSTGYLAGIFTVSWNQGVATFDRLQAYCAPGFNLSLLITYDSVAGNIDPVKNMTLVYRPCVRGEHLKQDRACSLCTNGTFSLIEPADVDLSDLSEAKVCQRCPEDSDTCFGDQIVLDPGYWRNSEISATVQDCPFDMNSCPGGTAVGDASCTVGFRGPLCAVCQSGYIYSPFTRTCTECDSSYIEVVVAFALLILIAAMAYSLFKRFKAVKREAQCDSMGEVFAFLVIKAKLLGDNVPEGSRSAVALRMETFKKRLLGLMRVFLTYWQIITVSDTVRLTLSCALLYVLCMSLLHA